MIGAAARTPIWVVCLLAIVWPLDAGAIAWRTFDKAEILEDARFVGTAVVESGVAVIVDGEVCAVSYKARVSESVVGPDRESVVDLHVLRDHRLNMGLGFLEVGSEYFVFAGNRETHSFLQITDFAVSTENSVAEDCPAEDEAYYVFMEFTGRIEMHEGDRVLKDLWFRQIEGVRELESYYWSDEDYDYYLEASSIPLEEQIEERLSFIALRLESLLQFFRDARTS